jgi:predicted ATPase
MGPDAGLDLITYPFIIPIIREIGSIDFHPDASFHVGERVLGKSMFLELVRAFLGSLFEVGTRTSGSKLRTRSIDCMPYCALLVALPSRPMSIFPDAPLHPHG